jgi:hypothetical protein
MSRLLSLGLRRSLFCLLLAGLPLSQSRADIPSGPPPAPAANAPVAKAPAAADSEGFVPENRPATMSNVEEGIPAGPLVATAYGFIWAAVLVFVGLTARRTRQLELEIAQLAERLTAAKPDSAS